MTVVALALASAALFGAMTVAVKLALRGGVVQAGALATILPALVVALVVAAGDAILNGVDLHGIGPFALAGLLAPGGSQILFTLAISEAGASRTSIAVGAAPLVSVTIALLALHEPARAPLLAGAVLVVAGGVALASERVRPEHVRAVGLLYAVGATVLFASRDNLVRHLATGDPPRPETAAAVTLLVGSIVALGWARRMPSARELRPFVPAGLCFGVSYVLLFEAFYRGRVTVVGPLVATESLWGVGLSVLLLRRSELVGRRLLAGAALVVGGGAVIGAFR